MTRPQSRNERGSRPLATVTLAGLPAGAANSAIGRLGALVDQLLGTAPLAGADRGPEGLPALARSGLAGLGEFLSQAREVLGDSVPARRDPVTVEAPIDLTAEVAAPLLAAALGRESGGQPTGGAAEEADRLAGWILDEVGRQLRGGKPRPWPG